MDYAARFDGPMHELRLGGVRIYHVTDAEVVRELLYAKAASFPDRGATAIAQFFREADSAFVNTTGENWKKYRGIGAPPMNKGIDRLAQKVSARSANLVAYWSEQLAQRPMLEVQMDKAAGAVTLEVITSTIFSYELDVVRGDQESLEFAKEFRNLLQANDDLGLDVLNVYQNFPTSPRLAKEAANDALDNVFMRLVRERKEQQAAGEDVPRDLLGALIDARDDDGNPLPQKAVTNTLTEMMVAGHDTTASTVACALTLLAYHPRWMAAVLEELDRELGGAPIASLEDIGKLKVLERVIKETMRLYPAVAIVLRRSDDVSGELGGVTIPPRTGLWASPYVLGRQARYWDAPTAFQPSRFADAEGKTRKDSEFPAYFPFGGGPRVCLGARLATLEATTLVAALLQAFDVRVAPALKQKMDASSGEIPMTYQAGLMAFPTGIPLEVRQRS